MRGRLAVTLVSLLLGSAPVAAEQPADQRSWRPGREHAFTLPAAAHHPADPVGAWLASATGSADATFAEHGAGNVRPLPDLDGDAVPDVLVSKSEPDANVFECRSGATGRLLREFAAPTLTGLFRAGAAWTDMVVASATTSRPGPTSPPEDVTLTITRLRECEQVWTRSFTGQVFAPGGILSSELPYARGVLTRADGTVDVVVETQTVLAPPSDRVTRTATTLLDGADGATRLETGEETYVDQVVQVVTLPDLTGDRVDDFGVALTHREAGPVLTKPDQLVARRSADGAELWITDVPVEFDTYARDPGDADGDGVTDVVLGTVVSGLGTAMVSGADGTVRWQHPGEIPQLLGDIPGRGRVLRVARPYYGTSGHGWEVAAVDLAGKEVYRVVAPLGQNAVGSSYRDDHLGDVDGDGVLDIAYDLSGTDESGTTTTAAFTISGGTGARRDGQVAALMQNDAPYGAGSLDGALDDVHAHQGARLRLLSGDTLATIGTGHYPGAAVFLLATEINRDRCRDLVGIVVGEERRAVVALDGATGALTWAEPRLADSELPRLDTGLRSCRTAARKTSGPPLATTGPGSGWAMAVASVLALLACAMRRTRLANARR